MQPNLREGANVSEKLKIMQEKLTGPDSATEDNNLISVPAKAELVEDKGKLPQPQSAG